MPEDSLGSHREVHLTGVAAVETILARRNALLVLALRAGNSVRPETALKVLACRGLVREQFKEFEGANR